MRHLRVVTQALGAVAFALGAGAGAGCAADRSLVPTRSVREVVRPSLNFHKATANEMARYRTVIARTAVPLVRAAEAQSSALSTQVGTPANRHLDQECSLGAYGCGTSSVGFVGEDAVSFIATWRWQGTAQFVGAFGIEKLQRGFELPILAGMSCGAINASQCQDANVYSNTCEEEKNTYTVQAHHHLTEGLPGYPVHYHANTSDSASCTPPGGGGGGGGNFTNCSQELITIEIWDGQQWVYWGQQWIEVCT